MSSDVNQPKPDHPANPSDLPRASFLEAEKADNAKQQALQPTLFTLEAAHESLMVCDGNYSGERLFSQRRDIYDVIVALLGEGQSIRAIKKACKVHHKTIQAVADREKIAIDTGKERVIADLRLAQHLLAETLVEDIIEGRIAPASKPLAIGIVTDKLELLTGGVTDRTETIHINADAPVTWDDWMDRVKKVNGREIPAGTGEVGKENELKGPASVHRLPAGDLPRASTLRPGESVIDGQTVDAESAALPRESSDATRFATQQATKIPSPLAPDPAAQAPEPHPGEGGAQGQTPGGHDPSG